MALLRRRELLLGYPDQPFEVLCSNRIMRDTGRGFERLGQRLGSDGEPNRSPLRNAELDEGRKGYDANERGNHGFQDGARRRVWQWIQSTMSNSRSSLSHLAEGTDRNPGLRPESITFRPWEYSARLRKLQRGEWWIWALSVLVLLALTAGIVSLSLPQVLQNRRTAAGTGIFQTVLGLIFLVLIFISYLTYEKVLINRLRFELAEGQFQSALWHDLALTDPLTGLSNRRFAERQLATEISRAHRTRYPFTLVIFDLNNFKQTNDRFGHPAGDRVLKSFANRLRSAVRQGDVPIRLGGDEFLLLLTECDISQVSTVLERLRGIEVQVGGTRIPVNFSSGSTEYQRGDTPEDLLRRADAALYREKEARKQSIASLP